MNTYPTPKFKVGDKVNFKNRCQNSLYMEIQEVDVTMFDVKYKVNYLWWTEGCFITHEEWKRAA